MGSLATEPSHLAVANPPVDSGTKGCSLQTLQVDRQIAGLPQPVIYVAGDLIS